MNKTRSASASFARNSLQRGKEVEDFVLSHLEREKFRLLERNFHCKGGELDLIMMDRDELVFVEVRYRSSIDFGDGIESVDHHKQRKLRIAAETWLQRNPQITFRGCRFDVISVSGENSNYRIEWVDDAF